MVVGSACKCEFLLEGLPMDSTKCGIHEPPFDCELCDCEVYRPKGKPRGTREDGWPLCVCGHAAVSHDT